ncbi:hypothetical protein [Geodermatophilus ruber]|uniref:Uncharacterized protein n=1 Tax=Geodermatophilus ruber TaxID=504800 RepID=A0A1I4AZQ4_9ACTN|nr:hypothetical protein [Geodermatophilus ruber]SFK61924.1 hypothetical protein SAMN04488085_102476 [Geodermatophilus ruber]
MIVAAGLLVLIGLGLFVGGLGTGVTALYWSCVVACALAAVLLVLTRVRMSREATAFAERAAPPPSTASAALPAAPEPPTAVVEPPAPAAEPPTPTVPAADGEPGEEDVEVTDLLLVVDARDEVLVVDEHPRYHLAGCRHLTGHEPIPLPLAEARTDGFTPCATCRPVRHVADAERARNAARTP